MNFMDLDNDAMRKMTAMDLLNASEKEARQRVENGDPLRLSPKAEAGDEEASIYIQEAIGGWWGLRAKDFVAELDALTAPVINLHINSPGGFIFEARDIEAAIGRKIEAGHTVVAHVNGMAASAATYIAVAASKVRMADGAMFMIHNAWGVTAGDAKGHRDNADLLDTLTAGIARNYERKTGADSARVKAWMDAETWFDAHEAKKEGFVDEVFIPGAKKKDKDKKAQAAATAEPVAGVAEHAAVRARALRLAEMSV